ncbi:sensor histidine kinase [Atopobacter phocae]|uniref:sensor histidine kinase n=1 Tax=Atopobacter phocae TaxID=136492 RepID=UPI00047156A4|nr:HAMP domain-containing sensor histidine kinase [Atopobacter phocae]
MSESRWYHVRKNQPQRLKKSWWLFLTVTFFSVCLILSTVFLFLFLNYAYESSVKDAKERANYNISLLQNENVLTSFKITQNSFNFNQPYLEDAPYSDVVNHPLEVRFFNRSREAIFSTVKNPVQMDFTSLPRSRATQFGKTKVFQMSGPIYNHSSNQLLGYYQFVDYLGDYKALKREAVNQYIIFVIFSLLFSTIAGYIMSTILFRPIHRLSRIITNVDEDNIHQVLLQEPKRKNEFYDIIFHLNHLLKRISYYLDQQKHFVEDASHELRTPVAIVEGHLNLLNRWGKDDPEVLEESLQASLSEIGRMKILVQEMLDLQRADQAVMMYKEETTEIVSHTKMIHHNFELLYPDFIFFLHNELNTDQVYAQIYSNHYEQVLVILLDNAVKYSLDRKEVHISLSLDSQNIHIAVQDFGEGMSSADQAKVFSRFFRVDKARSRESGGNGLGLSIAKKLIDNYNGNIRLESVLNHGSIFRIVLPLKSNDSEDDVI